MTINESDLQIITEIIAGEVERPVIISSAFIKDEFCNYGYEINQGVCKGDKVPSRKGSAVVHNDMLEAFENLKVHLAILDDSFVGTIAEDEPIEDLTESPILNSFHVTGFKVSGSDDNEGYSIVGEKFVRHGSVSVETPKIKKASHYKYFEELQQAVVYGQVEVERYLNGKAAPKIEQGSIDFPESDESDDFDNPM